MITAIKVGDITSPANPKHIIIGMNSKLNDVTGIGRPFVNKIHTAQPIKLDRAALVYSSHYRLSIGDDETP